MDSSMLETLTSYVPTLLLQKLLAHPVPTRKPSAHHFDAAVLFARIEGVNSLVPDLPAAADDLQQLTQILNTYFSMLVDFIKAEGGDILSLSGDCTLILWPTQSHGMPRNAIAALTTATRRAVQCALTLQNLADHYTAPHANRITLRIGVAAGKVFTASVGGALGRWEFLGSGQAILQAYRLISDALPGDIMLAPEAHALIRAQCVGKELENDNFRVENVRFPLPATTLETPTPTPAIAAPLRAYIPGAVLNNVTTGQTGWLTESREVTTLHINIPAIHGDVDLDIIHNTMRTMQRALYRHAGSVSKLLLNHTGLVLVAALGLPPLSYSDTAVRGVQAAQRIAAELLTTGLECRIGVATAKTVCSSIGNARRRAYTMIGTSGIRAAALSAAVNDKTGPILCDAATYNDAKASMDFSPSVETGLEATAYRPK